MSTSPSCSLALRCDSSAGIGIADRSSLLPFITDSNFSSFLLQHLAHSHEGPKSAEEKASLNKLKEASYLCAPQIAAYNAERQRQWTQKTLAGTSYQDKQAFIEAGGVDTIDGGKTLLACDAVTESKIRNHTCVLAPESTEGPYFHVSVPSMYNSFHMCTA